MSQLDIKIRKLQDNGSTFRANIETLYLGGVRSAKVDELRFELPEEWKNCTVTLHVQRLSGTKPDPQILDENNSALVDRRWTLEKEGTWMLLAINDSGYIAMTKPGKYTCYDTIDTDTTTENITPSIYEQFVAEVTKYAKQALESMNAAKASEEAAAKSAKEAANSAASMEESVRVSGENAKKAANSAAAAKKSEEAAAKSAEASENSAKKSAESESASKASEEKAKDSEEAAKKSEDAAALSETKSAASEKNAKDSETAAKQALKDTETEHIAALKDIARARTTALTDVANSTRTATAAAETATQQATAAAGSASTAATKAGEAATSAGAAKDDADRAEKASTDAANAAMTALQKAKDAGDFKGDKGDTGPQGPSGTIIKAYDVTLAASGWKATSDTAAKNAGWAYQCAATVSGCTAALEPSATVSLESVVVAQKAGLGSICSTGAGFCRFYAEKVPSAAISLRLLLMERGQREEG